MKKRQRKKMLQTIKRLPHNEGHTERVMRMIERSKIIFIF